MARMLLPKVPYNYTVCTAIAHGAASDMAPPMRSSEMCRKFRLKCRFGTLFASGFCIRVPSTEKGIEQMMEAIGHGCIALAGGRAIFLMNSDRRQLLFRADRIRFLGYIEPRVLPSVTAQAFAGMNLVSNDGKSYYYSLSNKFLII